jgi:micrococcal nuclease
MKKLLVLSAFAALLVCKVSAQNIIAPKNAAKHIGETVTMSDKVFSGKLIKSSNTTLLYLGGYAPNQELTVMIPGAYRAKFKGKPEIDYRGKYVIVTGKLIPYKSKPEIVITSPKQLKLILVDNAHTPKRRIHVN